MESAGFVTSYGYAELFLLGFAEFGFIPVATLPILMAAGAVSAGGRLDPVAVAVSVASGGLPADLALLAWAATYTSLGWLLSDQIEVGIGWILSCGRLVLVAALATLAVVVDVRLGKMQKHHELHGMSPPEDTAERYGDSPLSGDGRPRFLSGASRSCL
jgi:membrane protein DedA with SNARE-associated domain